MKSWVFCLHAVGIKKGKAIVNCTLSFFTNTNLLKMAEEIQKSDLVQYTRDFDRRLEDFTGTDRYMSIVTEYKKDWRKIYDELFDIFNTTVWKFRNEDEEGDPILKIDVSQRDNYTRQFDKWLRDIKDTCPEPKLFYGGFRNIKELNKHSRFFMKYVWNPEKNDEDGDGYSPSMLNKQ